MPRSIETVVTYLEMTTDPRHRVSPPDNMKLLLMRAENPPIEFYRYLYDAVGRHYTWVDRRYISDEKLAEAIGSKDIEIWVVYVAGVPAGYFEIDGRDTRTVELKYFGLIRDFHGRGLGKWLLAEAIRACWARAPERVIVDTCSLDGPAALPLYQKMGFSPYDRKTKLTVIGDDLAS